MITGTTPPVVTAGAPDIWIDTTDPDSPLIKYWDGDSWEVAAAGETIDEVWIGPDDPAPANPLIELWYDTDAVALATGDEVWIGTDEPTDPSNELWVDTDDGNTLMAKVDGVWTPISSSGGGGTDEVWIGPDEPLDPALELWVDTDTANLSDPNVARWNSAWGQVAKSTATTTQPGIGQVWTEILDSRVTFTALAGRRYLLSGQSSVQASVGSGCWIQVYDVDAGVEVAVADLTLAAPNYVGTHHISGDVTPGAATKTYCLRGYADAGTMTTLAYGPGGSAGPTLRVEDVGPIVQASEPPAQADLFLPGQVLWQQIVKGRFGVEGHDQTYIDQTYSATFNDSGSYPFDTMATIAISGITGTGWRAGFNPGADIYSDSYPSPIPGAGGLVFDWQVGDPTGAASPYWTKFRTMNGMHPIAPGDGIAWTMRLGAHDAAGAINWSGTYDVLMQRIVA